MIDLNKYDKYIYSSNSGKNFKKIQENKFIFYIKYKYFNSPEDRMIFNFYDDHITSRWEKRHSKIAEYTELRKEQLKENFGPDKNRIYTDYELDNLIPIKPIEYIAQLTKKLYNTDDRLGFLIQKEKPQIFNNNNEFMHFDYTSSLTVPVKIML
jgi:hypothetical protein